MSTGVILGTGWKDQECPKGLIQIPRLHLYEGHSLNSIYIHLNRFLDKIDNLIITNASGSVNNDFGPGNVYCIFDHLNLTGEHPKVGFLPMDDPYVVVPGYFPAVYAQVRGPIFETAAEARMLSRMGADVVGMSTALEAVWAKFHKIPVVGLTLVTNYSGSSAGHDYNLALAENVDLTSHLERAKRHLEG